VQPRPMPVIGTQIRVEFPKVAVPLEPAGHYTVTDVDERGDVTAWPVFEQAPPVQAGTPCLVDYHVGGERFIVDAMTVSSGAGGVVLQLSMADPEPVPGHHRPVAVTIEIPGSDLGLVEGVTEEISLGGLRVLVPVAVPVDRRAFVSLGVADATPILAAARTLSCSPAKAPASYVLRVVFTMVTVHDQARLFAMVKWAALERTGPPRVRRPQLPLLRRRTAFGSDPPRGRSS
jgi:hypothetical protein